MTAVLSAAQLSKAAGLMSSLGVPFKFTLRVATGANAAPAPAPEPAEAGATPEPGGFSPTGNTPGRYTTPHAKSGGFAHGIKLKGVKSDDLLVELVTSPKKEWNRHELQEEFVKRRFAATSVSPTVSKLRRLGLIVVTKTGIVTASTSGASI